MGIVDLGKVRGTQTYTGNKITGSNANATVFPETGIAKAYEGDLYINTDVLSEFKGNVYECTVAGEPDAAKWIFKGSIRGPKVDTVNNLKSTSTEDALSAYQGKRLLDMMKEAGVFSRKVVVDYDGTVFGAKLTIDNVNSTFSFLINGREYKYTYEAAGKAETTTLSVSLGTNLGMEANGGILTEIRSSAANIYYYVLTDNTSAGVYSKTVDIWESVNDNKQSHEITGTIVDGDETFYDGPIKKVVNGIKKVFFPITHAKAVWFEKKNGVTVYDKIVELVSGLSNEISSRKNAVEDLSASMASEITGLRNSTSSQISNEASERKLADDTLAARMDTFTSLPSGSTSGDAELQDIRVGAGGEVYGSAGEAVRGQIGELKGDLVNDVFYLKEDTKLIFTFGINADGLKVNRRASTDYYIEIDSDFEIYSDDINEKLSINITLYDSEKNQIQDLVPTRKNEMPKIYYNQRLHPTAKYMKVWLTSYFDDNVDLMPEDKEFSKTIKIHKQKDIRSFYKGIKANDMQRGRKDYEGAFCGKERIRATTLCFYKNEPDVIINNTLMTDYKWYLSFYDENFDKVEESNWYNNHCYPYKINESPYFTITAGNNSDTEMTDTMIQEFCESIKYSNIGYGYTINASTSDLHYVGNLRCCELNRKYVKDAYIKLINDNYNLDILCYPSISGGEYINDYGWVTPTGGFSYTDAAVRVKDCYIQCCFAKSDRTSQFTKNEFVEFYRRYNDGEIYEVIESIEQKKIGDITKNQYPMYYDTEVKNTVDDISVATTFNPIKFAMITDLHDNTPNFLSETVYSQVMAIKDIHKKIGLDFVICGGDLTDGSYSKKSVLLDKFSEQVKMFHEIGIPVLFIRGNHDDNSYVSSKTVSNVVSRQEFFARCIAPFAGKKTVDDKLYYYQDFDDINTRIICLDFIDYPWIVDSDGKLTYCASGDGVWRGYSDDQVNWLLSDALNCDKRIIITSHYSTHPNLMTDWEKSKDHNYTVINDAMIAYNNRRDIMFGGKTYSFSNKNGKVLCQVTGHSHSFGAFLDNGIVWSTTGSPSTEVTKRVFDNTTYETMGERNFGDITEAHFNVFVCDNNNVDIISFGQMGNKSFSI